MIHVTYYRSYHRLTVSGHANSGRKGKDLICCAASTLAYTMGANVEQMYESGIVRNPVTVFKDKDGEAEISCNPKPNMKNLVTMVFDSICVGFEMLAAKYPDFVSYEIRP